MNRRGFFKLFGAAVAGIALERAIPLGRVWSFPTNLVVPEASSALVLPTLPGLATIYYDRAALDRLRRHMSFADRYLDLPVRDGGLINFVAA